MGKPMAQTVAPMALTTLKAMQKAAPKERAHRATADERKAGS
jgi:hypothetical protein